MVLVASVHDAAAARLEAAIAELSATLHRPLRQRRIVHGDLPLEIAVAEPHRVGIDRLAAAAAAGMVRRPGRGTIIVDCGTAATVDLLSPDGVFLGGAIMPGPALMAQAAADGTSRLPEVVAMEHAMGMPPVMPGRSTQEAIIAGIGWGTRGAISRLVEEARSSLGADADVILTGGWAQRGAGCPPRGDRDAGACSGRDRTGSRAGLLPVTATVFGQPWKFRVDSAGTSPSHPGLRDSSEHPPQPARFSQSRRPGGAQGSAQGRVQA